MMDTVKQKGRLSVSIFFYFSLIAILCLFQSACSGGSTPAATLTPLPVPPTGTPFAPLAATLASTPSCLDDLTFLSDLTLPDYTTVAPGSSLDKQWLVQNSGSCNWDTRYRLRLTGGDLLGAPVEQALYPARVGTQATVRILFMAPLEAGNYLSEWQAFGPDGNPFGEPFAIRIVVSQ